MEALTKLGNLELFNQFLNVTSVIKPVFIISMAQLHSWEALVPSIEIIQNKINVEQVNDLIVLFSGYNTIYELEPIVFSGPQLGICKKLAQKFRNINAEINNK